MDYEEDNVFAIVGRGDDGNWHFVEPGQHPYPWKHYATLEEVQDVLARRAKADDDRIAACVLDGARMHAYAWLDHQGAWKAW